MVKDVAAEQQLDRVVAEKCRKQAGHRRQVRDTCRGCGGYTMGCQAVIEAGGAVLAQDEASSVVWGMPGAVSMAGLCFGVLPLAEIGPRLRPYAYGKV